MEHAGEKTEAPTPRRLEEAQRHGQVPRSGEVQTVFVLLGALCGLAFSGREVWQLLAVTIAMYLGHLHDTPVSINALQAQAADGVLLLGRCAGPVVGGAMLGGLLAGILQNRFTTASEALGLHWEKLNPVEGIKRVVSMRSAMPTAVAMVKLTFIVLLAYSTVREVIGDPLFRSSVGVPRIAEFLAESSLKIGIRVLVAMGVIAAADYGYQFWRNYRDLMMTKQEVKDEVKNSEGNPLVKAGRRRLMKLTKRRRALAEVPKADVVVTNPTHIAVALRYDRKSMKAPTIVAKGIRKQAERIRELAQQRGVPLVENKPLARLMFRYGKEGAEIPAQLYVAVAEVLAFVYRNNPYRYYSESLNQAGEPGSDAARR